MPLWLWIMAGVALLIVPGIAMTFPIARKVYNEHLVRQGRDRWKRGVCSFPDDAEMVEMYRQGALWQKENGDCARAVEIRSFDGLKLCGEYYDFGFKRAVLLLSGRAETLTYGYFFAQPYRKLGYNVLVIDDRGHGESDGDRNNVGLVEYRDVQDWIRFLIEREGNGSVLLHGICIGAASALYALTRGNVPKGVEGFVSDGMYMSFRETFRAHMVAMKRPVFPVLDEVMLLIWIHAGKNPGSFGPWRFIRKLKTPILMLFGREDVFSLPERSQKLIERCPAPKTVVWFDHGAHSHLRIRAPEKYDSAIARFTETLKR